MAKIPRKTASYRLPAATSDAVRLMADIGQVTQADIIIEAVRILSARLLLANQKAGIK